MIYDLNGRLLINKTAVITTEKIDVSLLDKGIYLIKVMDEKTIRTTKMIKQ
jgi:hypothetical protein